MLKGWVKNEPLKPTRQHVAYAMRQCECFGKEDDPNQLLKATFGEGENTRPATFEELASMLIHGPFPSDAGPGMYPGEPGGGSAMNETQPARGSRTTRS